MLIDKLLDKSKEAFIVAIEIYNKPTIKYRVEGFALFICNAWELMLKAYLINTKGTDSIYFKDKPNRTISLEKCIKDVFTNDKDPLRLNLEKIVELRNTSTHFIVEEYEMVYISLFQACIFNFIEKMDKFHSINVAELIPSNFINLTINISNFDEDTIRAKYPKEISDNLLKNKNIIEKLNIENNQIFSIKIEHNYFFTKNKDKASTTVCIDNTSSNGVRIVKEVKNVNETHKYRATAFIEEINKRLKKLNIELKINQYHFQNLVKYYKLKEQDKFCFKHEASGIFTYSQQAVDFIFNEIKKDHNNILQNVKNYITKNKLTPGAKEF